MVRFGAFELDLDSGELRKNGAKVRLQEKPFQVLKALVERPYEVVSRDELKDRLWPDDTFVVFEDGLSTAVSKVRRALRDSARNPRFIETLPKRGYRFIAPVDLDSATRPSRASVYRWVYGLLAAGLAALLLATGLYLIEDQRGPPLLKFVLAPGEDVHDPVVSPNGRFVAFTTMENEGALWIREMSAERPWQVPHSAGARWPLWSPDSSEIVFQSAARLLRVDARKGASPAPFGSIHRLRGVSWSQDGNWLYKGAERMSSAGGEFEPVLDANGSEVSGFYYTLDPVWLPLAGRRVILLHFPEVNEEPAGIYLFDYDAGRRQFLFAGSHPAWSPTGHILFQEEGAVPRIRAQPFSLETLRVSGDSFVVAENATSPSVSDDGKLVYLSGAGAGLQVVLRDAAGKLIRPITPVLKDPQYVLLSPSGQEVAFTALTGDDREIWAARLDQTESEPRRITFNNTSEGVFLWSPDGKRMLYRVKGNKEAPESYLVIQSLEDGRVERLPADGIPAQWWGDGNKEHLFYCFDTPPGRLDYGEAPVGEDFEFKTFLDSAGVYTGLSPSGELLLYMDWWEKEFIVQPFPSGGGRWQLDSPTERVRWPRWSRSSQEIFYYSGDQMRAATYTLEPHFQITGRRTLFRAEGLGVKGHFDVTPDGQRFVLLDALSGDKPTLRVTQNWFEEFRER